MNIKLFAKLKNKKKTTSAEISAYIYYPVEGFYTNYTRNKNMFTIKDMHETVCSVEEFDFFTDDMKKIDVSRVDLW